MLILPSLAAGKLKRIATRVIAQKLAGRFVQESQTYEI
jgi:hypothetical protein